MHPLRRQKSAPSVRPRCSHSATNVSMADRPPKRGRWTDQAMRSGERRSEIASTVAYVIGRPRHGADAETGEPDTGYHWVSLRIHDRTQDQGDTRL